jgi:hypothetical protein
MRSAMVRIMIAMAASITSKIRTNRWRKAVTVVHLLHAAKELARTVSSTATMASGETANKILYQALSFAMV